MGTEGKGRLAVPGRRTVFRSSLRLRKHQVRLERDSGHSSRSSKEDLEPERKTQGELGTFKDSALLKFKTQRELKDQQGPQSDGGNSPEQRDPT